MLDDTCYFIGFDSLASAQIAAAILNSALVQDFLKSIIFIDSKRAINKDILMRIDLVKVFEMTDFKTVKSLHPQMSVNDWDTFSETIQAKPKHQMALF